MTDQTREKIKPIKLEKGSELHLSLLMAPYSLNLVVGEDRACLLRYAKSVYQAATLAERERCALVCELEHPPLDGSGEYLAAAIRQPLPTYTGGM